MSTRSNQCKGCGAAVEIGAAEYTCSYCGTKAAPNRVNTMPGPVTQEPQMPHTGTFGNVQHNNANIHFNRVGTPQSMGRTPRITPARAVLIVAICLVSIIVIARVASGSRSSATVHDFSAEAVEIFVMEEPMPDYAAATQGLAGTWYWINTPYYVLEDDGRGTMAGSAIRWWAANGVLNICVTPDSCGNRCVFPASWYYTISGNQLVLTSTTVSGMSFTYTRRQTQVVQGQAYYSPTAVEAPEAASYALDIELELYPFHVTINEIFLVTDARTPPDDGNKHVGISFIFHNMSSEVGNIMWSNISVYVDGFLTGTSFTASSAIERGRGSYSFSNRLSAGRSVRNHYAVEVPIGTTELEIELNCGAFGANRQTEIVKLSVPQV